jgi:glutathione S-transferase
MSHNTVTAFRWVPPAVQGLVRDLRVRWALEEADLPYEAKLIALDEGKSASYRVMQPFGQVPAFEQDGLRLFESGAIVLHIAERSTALMPHDSDAKARVRTWMFAALNTVEPPIMMLNLIDREKAPPAELRGKVVQLIQSRLNSLAAFLGERQYLIDDRFTAADLLMVTVLRILRATDLVAQVPALDAYRQRGEARPAFQKALKGQLQAYAENSPPA